MIVSLQIKTEKPSKRWERNLYAKRRVANLVDQNCKNLAFLVIQIVVVVIVIILPKAEYHII